MDEKKIKLEVTIEEANLIFKSLGKLPFEQVYELIGKLNDQANLQLTSEKKNGATPPISMKDLVKQHQ